MSYEYGWRSMLETPLGEHDSRYGFAMREYHAANEPEEPHAV